MRKQNRPFATGSTTSTVSEEKPELLVGVLGCMAGTPQNQITGRRKIPDLVCRPDAYRDLPKLIAQVDEGDKAINTFLSREET